MHVAVLEHAGGAPVGLLHRALAVSDWTDAVNGQSAELGVVLAWESLVTPCPQSVLPRDSQHMPHITSHQVLAMKAAHVSSSAGRV